MPHEGEHYVAIKSEREGDRIHFSMWGGVNIEENWDKVRDLLVPIDADVEDIDLEPLLADCPEEQRDQFRDFLATVFGFYASLGFTYLELNPFVVSGDTIVALDTVARLDDTEAVLAGEALGRDRVPDDVRREAAADEERFIKELDAKTGASLKLTVLNPKGRVWTMIAGGGASVIYADTVVDLGFGEELANYGEYSGNPTTEETYQYARTDPRSDDA